MQTCSMCYSLHMKVKSLATLLRRKPVTIRMDVVKFLPLDRAIIGQYDRNRETIFIGVVELFGKKTRT